MSQITYAKVLLCDESKTKLLNLIEELSLENPVTEDMLHTTVVYSRTPVTGLDSIEVGDINASPIRFDLFDSNDKKCLVVRLHSLDLQQLHKITRNNGASYDYDAYHPHITLSYNHIGEIPSDDILKGLGILRFNEFRIEPFNANFGS